MRIPFLILCLVVVYGACRTYERPENVDLQSNVWRAASKIPNENGNYEYDYDYDGIPFAKPFSRQKRTVGLLLKPITLPLNALLKLLGFEKNIISSVIDLVRITFGALLGQNVCPEGSSVSILGLVTKTFTDPIKTFQTVLCNSLQTIGSINRVLMNKIFKLFASFFWKVFLPGLHTTLNTLNKTGLLPPQISAAIAIFNMIYGVLRIMGYVPN
ncbi:hypothetical protein PUN28_009705 [Cardiocondyla obscurior]|uniref:Uncharacterized protein n=1 Tax=Cardiocondyla obscurior TaxID=286306 RepID=A0AAW2FZJ9_9HYME